MTDNEIIKALELCFAEKGTKQTCGECPYHKFGELCKVKRGRDTLDLINRQQAEIQQITEKFNCQQTVYADLSKIIKDQKAEIERLEELSRKHGEWIKHKPDPEAMKQQHDLGIAKGMSEKSIFWTCSCCNGWGTPAHKHCSQCGAKMDKKEGADNG